MDRKWYEYSPCVGPTYKGASAPVVYIQTTICPSCGAKSGIEKVVPHKLEPGRYFPTLLETYDFVHYDVFSETALDAFSQAGLTGIEVISEFVLLDKQDEPLTDLPVRYYAVNITGQIDLDEKAMHLKRRNVCPVCGSFSWNREKMYDAYFDENSWDGSDFCQVKQTGKCHICTQGVLNVIAKKKLKGITLRYGHDLFRIRELDLKAHQKMIAAGKEYTPCYLRR